MIHCDKQSKRFLPYPRVENVMSIDGHLTIAVEYDRGCESSDVEIRSPFLFPFKSPLGNSTESVIFIFERVPGEEEIADGGNVNERSTIFACFCLRSPDLVSPENTCFLLTPGLFQASIKHLLFPDDSCSIDESFYDLTRIFSYEDLVFSPEGRVDFRTRRRDVFCLNSCVAAFERRNNGGQGSDSGSDSDSGSSRRGRRTLAPDAVYALNHQTRSMYDKLVAGRMVSMQFLWRRRNLPISNLDLQYPSR
jgi:hypothetical protein